MIAEAIKRTEKRAAVCSIPARRLFSLVYDIIAISPDRSCYASERALAKHLSLRKATVHAAKYELIEAGALCLSLRENGNRRNPRHRLTLPPAQKKKNAARKMLMSRVPDLSRVPVNEAYKASLGLCALSLWIDADRMSLVEFYLKSGLDLCALWPGKKKPIWTKKFAARLTFDQKLDTFYHDPALGVGVWLDPRFEVFDHDSDRLPLPEDTLVSVRANHAHVWFEASGEIYNTSGKVAPDLDTRAAGGLLVLPPTPHEDGQDLYQWQTLHIPKPVPPEYLALWHSRKMEGARAGVRLYELPARIEYGTRDNTIWSYGRSLKAAGADREFIAARLRQVNFERCKPPLSPDEVERKIRHVLTWKDDPEEFKPREKVA